MPSDIIDWPTMSNSFSGIERGQFPTMYGYVRNTGRSMLSELIRIRQEISESEERLIQESSVFLDEAELEDEYEGQPLNE